MPKRAALLCIVLAIMLATVPGSPAQPASAGGAGSPAAAQFERRVRQSVSQPRFRHSQFGIEVLDLASGRSLFALNSDKLFVPGSTAKLVTEGAALDLLGPDYRFHTRVYRTGPVSADGTLEGDLVLVAGGDPNLSARLRDDGTLAYTSYDHAYAGSLPGMAVAGDPLLVLKKLAAQVAARGIRRIKGDVLADTSLFSADGPEPGTGVMISPAMVNDNIVDVTVFGGGREGDPAGGTVAPLTPYLTIAYKVRTGKPGSNAALRFTSETVNADGSYAVTLEGSVPAGEKALAAYKVKNPQRFARAAFWTAVKAAGIEAAAPMLTRGADFHLLAGNYTPDKLVAEHVSAPLAAEVKVTLKTSQNLHAATMPYLLGALAGNQSTNALTAGFRLEREFLAKARLDLSGASLGDGEGGPGAAFTPSFMVRYLAFIARQPYAREFMDALPVMGRDGTLQYLQQKSPAAGHVRAKSGTYVYADRLNGNLLLLGKGLVGYVETRRGHRLAFAVYLNQVSLADMDQVEEVGELLGSIASAAYELL